MKIQSATALIPGKAVFAIPSGLSTSVAQGGIVAQGTMSSSTRVCVTPIEAGVVARVRAVNPVVIDVLTEAGGAFTAISSTITGATAATSYTISLNRVTSTTYLLTYLNTSNQLMGNVLTYNPTTKVFTPGTNTMIEGATCYEFSISPFSVAGLFFLVYGYSAGSYAYPRILTVTGTSLTFGAIPATSSMAGHTSSYPPAGVVLSDTKVMAIGLSGTTLCATVYSVSGTTLTRTSTNSRTDAAYAITSGTPVVPFKAGTDKIVILLKRSLDNELYCGFIETATVEPVFYAPIKLTSDAASAYHCSGAVLVSATELEAVWGSTADGRYMRITYDSAARTASVLAQSKTGRLYRYVTTPCTNTLVLNASDNFRYFSAYGTLNTGGASYELYKIDATRVTETMDTFVGFATTTNTVITKGVVTGLSGLTPGSSYLIHPMTGVLIARTLSIASVASVYGAASATTNPYLTNVNILATSSSQIVFTNSDYPY